MIITGTRTTARHDGAHARHPGLHLLRYGDSAHPFGFAIYSAARNRYEDAVLLTGFPTGSPQEALDTACTVHLAGIGHEPDI